MPGCGTLESSWMMVGCNAELFAAVGASAPVEHTERTMRLRSPSRSLPPAASSAGVVRVQHILGYRDDGVLPQSRARAWLGGTLDIG